MKCWDSFVCGLFGGALVLSVIMLNFPQNKQCVVEMGRGNVTHVLIGEYKE